MSTLEVSLVMLTAVFWVGNVVYYFRMPIYEWLDNRVQYEPVTDRLRTLLRKGRR